MASVNEKLKIPLPRKWTPHVRSAVLHVIGLAQYATVYTRSWAADSRNARVRLKAETDRLRQEVALLAEEIRIKDARMQRIDSHKRPHYPPTERMAILELRAARGWSQQQTADAFHLTAATISSWMHRLEESGAEALVQLREPVNRFPDFVRFAVQRSPFLTLQKYDDGSLFAYSSSKRTHYGLDRQAIIGVVRKEFIRSDVNLERAL